MSVAPQTALKAAKPILVARFHPSQATGSGDQPWMCPAHVTLGAAEGSNICRGTGEQSDPANAPVYQIKLSKPKPLPSLSEGRLSFSA